MDKSPDAFFRRIDPDYYYPTFGDDSTVAEMAPTMGKLFLRLGKVMTTGSGAISRLPICKTSWPG